MLFYVASYVLRTSVRGAGFQSGICKYSPHILGEKYEDHILETDIIHYAWHRSGHHTGERSSPVVEAIVESALKPKIGAY